MRFLSKSSNNSILFKPWSFLAASKIFVAALLMTISAGCARTPDDSYSSISLAGDLSMPVQVQIDNYVRRQPPAVYVRPLTPVDHKPTALFVPLRTMQQMNNAVTFSDLLSRQIWQVWLSQGPFSTLEYAPQAGPYDRNRALALARQKGAEVVIGGFINHFMDGGYGGESSISIAVEAFDVKTGDMIWSMSSGGLMEKEKKHDFYLFTINERNPGDPSGLIARSLAWDMGNEFRKWVNPYAGDNKASILDNITGNTAF